MSTFIIDCSVTAAWCFSDVNNEYINSVLHAFTENWNAFTPYIWILETLNVFWNAEKRKRISPAEITHFINLFNALPIEIEQIHLHPNLEIQLLSLSRSYNISVYDASYLNLSLCRNVPLATQDKKLITAAEKAGVAIFNPGQQ